MVAICLPTDTPLTEGMGSKDLTIYFCESSHVAYQIKGNRAQSTMKANMLSSPGIGSKGHIFLFSKSCHDAYEIKLEEV